MEALYVRSIVEELGDFLPVLSLVELHGPSERFVLSFVSCGSSARFFASTVSIR